MASLREIQCQFLQAVLAPDSAPCNWLATDAIAAAERLQIYRNNAQFNFVTTLLATYPVIEKLAGGDWFRQTALRYWQRYPSRCGDLQYVGDRFARFLHQELYLTQYAYFADMAHLEWACQEVLTATDSEPMEPAILSGLGEGEVEGLRFELRPDVRALRSDYPIFTIWRAHQNTDQKHCLDLSSGPNHILIVRRETHIELREFSAAQYHLLSALAAGNTLAQAYDLVLQQHRDFDLSRDLQLLFSLNIFANCQTASSLPNRPTKPRRPV